MMEYKEYFTEEHELLRKLARDFCEKEFTKEVLDEIEESGVFPEELKVKMGKAGFYGVKIPREYGGAGSDNRGYVAVLEEFARGSATASIYMNSPNSLGGGPLLLSGTEEQLRKYLVPVAKGEKRMAFGLTEPVAGSDAGGTQTLAEEDGGCYVLNGRKAFITEAPEADYAIIYAKTDPAQRGARGISAFIVDMHAPGVSTGKPERTMGLIGDSVSDIILEDVRVPREDMLGEKNKGFLNAMKTLNYGRIGVAAQSIGVAGAALEETVKYMKERKQFGQPLEKFQALRFMAAEMATKLAAARSLVYRAAYLKDMNQPASMECSMAKYYASEACNEICAKAVQIHGGYGFTKDYKVERLYRDCRIFTIYEGTSQVQQIVISGQLFK